jgi:hypothetical protein
VQHYVKIRYDVDFCMLKRIQFKRTVSGCSPTLMMYIVLLGSTVSLITGKSLVVWRSGLGLCHDR